MRILYIEKSNKWLAQCIDHDFAAEGRTLEEARVRIIVNLWEKYVLDTRDSVEPFSDTQPAPEPFHIRFGQSSLRLNEIHAELAAIDGFDERLDLPSTAEFLHWKEQIEDERICA